MSYTGRFFIEVSAGELIDKMTILELKHRNMKDPAQLLNVQTELDLIRNIIGQTVPKTDDVQELVDSLRGVNSELWQLEDFVRILEQEKLFGEVFVSAARSILKTNDHRYAIKAKLNDLCKSRLHEEKCYTLPM